MKKLCILASLICLLFAVPVFAGEEERYTSGDYEYTLMEDGTAEIVYCAGEAEELELPGELDGYVVTSIGDRAFWGNNCLTSITLPESINKMEGNPFFPMSDIKIQVSPDHQYLAVIDGVLFSKPDKRLIYFPPTKESYEVPEGIESIGAGAFSYSYDLISIDLPETVTSIGDYAFEECESLASIDLPESVTSIGVGAFNRCENLTVITLPESINIMGGNPFGSLSDIEIQVSPNHPYLEVIDGVLFSKPDKRLIYCPPTKESYEVPEGIENIGAEAFSFSYDLTSIDLPDSVTSIGNNAFFSCALTSIDLPESVTSIGDSAFGGCGLLTSIDLPENVTSIGYQTFWECNAMTSINMSKSVTSIGDYAFFDCTSLTSITLPRGVTSIGNGAFEGCNNLTLTVDHDSYAAEYCKEHGLNYTYPDANDWLTS